MQTHVKSVPPRVFLRFYASACIRQHSESSKVRCELRLTLKVGLVMRGSPVRFPPPGIRGSSTLELFPNHSVDFSLSMRNHLAAIEERERELLERSKNSSPSNVFQGYCSNVCAASPPILLSSPSSEMYIAISSIVSNAREPERYRRPVVVLVFIRAR